MGLFMVYRFGLLTILGAIMFFALAIISSSGTDVSATLQAHGYNTTQTTVSGNTTTVTTTNTPDRNSSFYIIQGDNPDPLPIYMSYIWLGFGLLSLFAFFRVVVMGGGSLT